jgi:hypothetical protein
MIAASTLDALFYVFRRGLTALDDSDNRSRLAQCDQEEFRKLVAELRTWPAGRHWLRAWSEDELRRLTQIWQAERARRGLGNGPDVDRR